MKELPKRKHPRLREYDYGCPGAYFITICTHNRRCLLSRIVGRGLAPAAVENTAYGDIAEEQLRLLEKRYPFVCVKPYVIMPNHIHFILTVEEMTAGASPRPTVPNIVGAYKSLTARECNKLRSIDKLFQTSFYEHIVRGDEDYDEIVQYIADNPQRWQADELYTP